MDALELALRYSGLLLKTMPNKEPRHSLDADPETSSINLDTDSYVSPLRSQLNESDCERHFEGFGELGVIVFKMFQECFNRCFRVLVC